MTGSTIEVRFTVPLADVPGQPRAEAEQQTREAFVLSLLRQGQISAGRAAEALGIDRCRLSDLMSVHGISPFDETMSRDDLERAKR